MNCPKCTAELPVGATYCPSCGAPRSEIDRLLRDAERAAKKAVDAAGAALDRAAKELQPTFDKAVSSIRPAVEEVARTVKPLADKTARAAKDVANAVRPAAETTAKVAIDDRADLIIVMNTPGGLLANMVQIVGSIQTVQDAGLAVYTYVPPVALAASAGSYIALATNATYMGSGSIIGPSTPYIVGGDPSEVQHVQNAMTAYISSLAQKNGYNVTAAANMALNNVAYPASEAAAIRLVSGMAETFDSFLEQVGLTGVPLTTFNEPLYDQFLSFLSDPTVDGLFILVGIIALVLDLFHRTLFLSVVAVIFIALGFLGAQVIGASIVGILMLI